VTVTDNSGATATASATVTVTPANQPPVARLTVTPSSGYAPLAVVASALGSSDPDGTIASYRFDFGDGTVVGPQTLPTAAHVYAAGVWTARVTVTDNGGATGTASVTVTVSNLLGPLLQADMLNLRDVQPAAALAPRVIPNPVRTEAQLKFRTSRDGPLSVGIFDLFGRRVRRLLDMSSLPAGLYTVTFDGQDDDGVRLREGMYFYRIRSAEGLNAGRLVIMR